MMQAEDIKIDVIRITMTLDEAHELSMIIYDHIALVEKNKKRKVAPVISELFEYFDGRLL